MENEKYIIVELIPEAISPDKGNLVQLSAIKIDGFKLVDRFDYRLDEDLIKNQDIKNMINYDKDSFKYVNSTDEILNKFKKWIGNLQLLVLNNDYTFNFLEVIDNIKRPICELLDMEYSDGFIERVIEKYKLEPSNYIVDLLYEALIYESNNK